MIVIVDLVGLECGRFAHGMYAIVGLSRLVDVVKTVFIVAITNVYSD